MESHVSFLNRYETTYIKYPKGIMRHVEIKIFEIINGKEKEIASQFFSGVKPKERDQIIDAIEEIAYKLSMRELNEDL